MKKTNTNGILHRILETKVLIIMKLTTFFFFVSTFALIASGTYSQNKTITINQENALIKDVLKEIEDQSGYFFIYNNEYVDVYRKINIKAKDQTINVLLDQIFQGQNVNYSIDQRRIILSPSENGWQIQQNKTISGKVTDSSGASLPGVSVVVKGTTTGAITDTDGKYNLTNIPADAMLVFSFVGMKSQEIQVGGKTNLDVKMEEQTIGIEEVVAIGYGTVKKSDLTGAVGSVKGKTIAERNTTQISTALQGAIPGLMVTRSSNAPGSAATLRVRGITNLSENDPLIIVDGVPGDLSQVHTDDVESISVLKDAASASIYGARAAAGVILVTTKRAKERDLSLNYNFEYGLEIPNSQPKQVGVQRYLEMVNEIGYNDNPSGGMYQTYTQEQVENWVANNATDPDHYPITDWYDLLVRKAAPRQTHSLSLAGGSKGVKTKASLSYDKTEGLYKVADVINDRYLLRVNNDFTINKYLNASLDFNVKLNETTEPSHGAWEPIRSTPAIYAYRWSHGGLADVKGGNNPYGYLTGGTADARYTKFGGKASIDFTPIEGLKISAVASPYYSITKTKTFVKKNGYTGIDDPNIITGYFSGHSTTSLSESRKDANTITTQLLATFEKKLGKHSFNLMAGNENYHFFYENISASREQYELTEFPYLDNGPATYDDNSGSAYENAYRSYFGRIMYNYHEKYLLQANIRYDGSSRFADGYRWGAFPSVSAGWVLSEEPFMKQIPELSFLKLRASIGTLGNEQIGNYPYQALMDFSSSLFYDGTSATTSIAYTGAAQGSYAVQDISWETTKIYDVGIDANFFENKLHFTGDYFYKKTEGMLIAVDIPMFLGLSNPDQNIGDMHTNGFDFEIGWNDQMGDLNYGISANLSDFISTMGYLNGTQTISGSTQIITEGSQYNEWYGYLSDGLFFTQEDLNNSPKLNSNVKVGDAKHKDISGPNGVPDGVISSEYDRVFLGGSLPRYTYGGNLYASYKGFDISMTFQGVGKQNVRITGGMASPMPGSWGNIPAIIDNKYWSSFNTDEENATARYPRITLTNKTSNFSMSDFWMFNGRYFRMKNVTIGYTLPSSLTQRVKINNVRFYVSGSDLFCLSKYPTGWDPERGDATYPITTSIIYGVSINF